MRAKLRELLTVDHDRLSSIKPVGDAFHVSLRALVGPADGEGEESFEFDVCSPAWLNDRLEGEPIVCGRFLLLSRRFEPDQIETYVRQRIEQTSGGRLASHRWQTRPLATVGVRRLPR